MRAESNEVMKLISAPTEERPFKVNGGSNEKRAHRWVKWPLCSVCVLVHRCLITMMMKS